MTRQNHMRVAAIDIGSNSIRLLVAEITGDPDQPGGIRTLARAGEPCRLGRGLDRAGEVDPELAETAAKWAAEFAQRARALGAGHIVMGATAALRSATNGSQVAEQIGAKAGIPVRIISGDDEARLVYRSVVAGLGSSALRSPCVVFDIGGGSTEVVSGVGGEAGRWTSLRFGAVNLTERFLHTNPPTAAEIARLAEAVRDDIMHQCALMPSQTPLLAGVGGTVTVLALLDRGLESYEPGFVEGWAILPARLSALIERLIRTPNEERRNLPAMGAGRADIVFNEFVARPYRRCITQHGLGDRIFLLFARKPWCNGDNESRQSA